MIMIIENFFRNTIFGKNSIFLSLLTLGGCG